MTDRHHSRSATAFALAAISFALVAALRYAGGLERIELVIHDRITEVRAGQPAHPDVAVILETEADLQRFGHPLSDEKLADILARINALKPALIAVDKYRDIPVAPGSAKLDKFLTDNPNIFWVAKYGAFAFDGVRPPKILEGSDRVGCADILVDHDLRVRRSLIVLGENDRVCPALAYVLTANWLASKSIGAGFDEKRNHALMLGTTVLPALKSWDGPYAGEDTAGYQVPVQYLRALPPTYSLSQLVDGKLPADALQGKIIVVGSSATSLRDFFEIPQRHVLALAGSPSTAQPGAIVHAFMITELLDIAAGTKPQWLVPVGWTFALAGAMALLCAFMLLSAMSIGNASLIAAAIIFAWVPLSALLAGTAIIIAPTAPMIAGLIASTAAAGLRAWREARDRQELMGWFSKHVSKEVAEAIWQGRNEFTADGRIPPRSVYVTVLFADIRSYTTVSESLPIPVMVAWLQRAISAMVAAVMENHGVVTRFAGDQVMAVFGVPIPRKTPNENSADAAHAIDAGLAMGEKLALLNALFAKENLPAARVRVGIFSGEVVQAGLGSADRFEFTVLGDVVNTASRLESYTTPDDGAAARVLIGEPTHQLVTGQFSYQPLGELELKGKTSTISVYRILGRATADVKTGEVT